MEKTKIEGLFKLLNFNQTDTRGLFNKNLNSKTISKINFNLQESFYSVNKKGVLRGMHFQTPPFAQDKIVYVSYGKILDVVLDLRLDSPSYGLHDFFEMSADSDYSLYIPSGLAHGFYTLDDNSIVNYLVSSPYSQDHDKGILYNSFGFNWKCENPIVSKRDLSFPNFKEFKSVF
jgi:dTDP-4-dehydrorhamnose 3,5-epimerase